MSELQATLEFSVELNKFYNVDLFQRGFYQIRTALKTPPKVPSKIEITLQRSQEDTERKLNNPGDDNEIPAHVINDMAVSKTFQILYRNEDLPINDVILYRFHTLVNSNQLEEEMSKLEILLVLELWFSEEQNGQDGMQQKAECVSQRTISIHINPFKGLHHHVPVLFDYFHLCCIEVTVHGTLIAIHQPFLSVPKQPKTAWSSRNPDQSSLETVYFGNRPVQPDPDKCLPINLHAAWQMHHRICNILLSAYESLQSMFELYLSDICGSQFKLEHIDCHQKLQKIMDNIRLHDNEEELIQNATVDITQLCACNVILWTQFLETSTLDQGIIFHLAKEHHTNRNATVDITQLCACNVILWTQFLETSTLDQGIIFHLAKEHHTNRVKRMAEGFFTHEYQKNECLACYEPSYHGHSDLERVVRTSLYLHHLPPLDLECAELDGDTNTIPIIFEDIYEDQTSTHDVTTNQRSSRSGSLSPSFSQNNSPQIRMRPKRNFIKNIRPDTFKRPSSFNLQEAEMARTRKSEKDCVLVGFRKTVASPNIHSQMVVNNLELGTFSPITSSSGSQSLNSMSYSVSLPSLVRSDYGRNSEGNLPDYVRVARRSLRAKKKNRHPKSIITVEIGGSDPNIKGEDLEEEGVGNIPEGASRRLKRAFTDPARRTSTSSYSDSSREGTLNRKTEESKSADTDVQTVNTQLDSDAGVKKQLNFDQELRKNLSESLRQVINPADLNDSDQSDDDTCVQNGFDEVLDSYTHPSTSESDSQHVYTSDSASTVKCETSSVSETFDDLSEIPVDKNRAGSEISSDHSHSNIAVSNRTSSTSRLEDVLSVSEISISKNKELSDVSNCQSVSTELGDTSSLCQSEASLNVADSQTTDTSIAGSQTTLTSKESGITADIISDRDPDTSRDSDKEVTVLELLREEYRKDMNISVSDFSDSGVSGISIRNNQKSSSDSNLLLSVDADGSDNALAVKNSTDVMTTSASFPDIYKLSEPKLVDRVGLSTINFISTRESLKSRMKYQGNLYSLIEEGESSKLASQIPYFHVPDKSDDCDQDGVHLIVCVHGLDGNSADLRLVKTYLEMSLPGYKLEFLMSERNQADTFAEFDTMTERLVSEIIHHIDLFNLKIARLSFVGHSLGTLLVRSALSHTDMIPYLPRLYSFLSLSGPHLGMLYNNSGLVNMGMWFMQKWKKSGSLLQLSLKDQPDPRQSFLYKLSQKPGLEFFKHVLLVGSSQDRYVPYHSSRIEMCKAAQRESTGLVGSSQDRYVPYHSSRIEMCKAAQRESTGLGSVYAEMVANILTPIVNNPKCKLIRYDVFHALPSTANTIIGRAAHIAVLDSEIFIEKFLMVCGLKYFK